MFALSWIVATCIIGGILLAFTGCRQTSEEADRFTSTESPTPDVFDAATGFGQGKGSRATPMGRKYRADDRSPTEPKQKPNEKMLPPKGQSEREEQKPSGS